jgi:hypothetical protein
VSARGRIGPWGRRGCRPVPIYAAPCRVESVTPRYFLPFRDTSNLRVGGSNPSRRAIFGM